MVGCGSHGNPPSELLNRWVEGSKTMALTAESSSPLLPAVGANTGKRGFVDIPSPILQRRKQAPKGGLTCHRSHNQPASQAGLVPEPQSPPHSAGRGLWEGMGCEGFQPRCSCQSLPQSHVDSDSSSSHSRQETPPTTASAAPIVTVESASAFGPATPPQRRCSSAQVGNLYIPTEGWAVGNGSQGRLWLTPDD